MEPVELHDGVVLRVTSPEHAEALSARMDLEEPWLSPWMTVNASLDAVRQLTENFARAHERRRSLACCMWRGDGIVGVCNAFDIAEDHGTVEFGYWLARAETGKGLMTSALTALVGEVFAAFDVQRAEIFTSAENAPARAVAERSGFVLEGVRRQCERINGSVVDHAMYGLLKPEWSAMVT